MPTYVYRYVDTGETFEVQQAFTDDALTEAEHPDTGVVMAVKKVFTPVGVTFKGDGFYKTDNRSSSKRGAASTDSSSTKSDSTSTDGTKTESSATASSATASSTTSSTSSTSTPSSSSTSGASGSAG
jgi:predicted nucleic acid-binding Zn ribbon protein